MRITIKLEVSDGVHERCPDSYPAVALRVVLQDSPILHQGIDELSRRCRVCAPPSAFGSVVVVGMGIITANLSWDNTVRSLAQI